jgi:hypothetical protein
MLAVMMVNSDIRAGPLCGVDARMPQPGRLSNCVAVNAVDRCILIAGGGVACPETSGAKTTSFPIVLVALALFLGAAGS